MRLYVIPAGTLRIDKGAVFTPGIDEGVLIEVPVPVYLIRTDDENVLVDTGLHPAHIDDPSYSFGLENADTVLARMQPEDRLEPRLAEVGLEIADITHVVNTHLHADHCGGNFLFPHAELIVQREHYQEALATLGEHPDRRRRDRHRRASRARPLDPLPRPRDGTGKCETAAADRRTGGRTPPLRTRRRPVADAPTLTSVLRLAGPLSVSGV